MGPSETDRGLKKRPAGTGGEPAKKKPAAAGALDADASASDDLEEAKEGDEGQEQEDEEDEEEEDGEKEEEPKEDEKTDEDGEGGDDEHKPAPVPKPDLKKVAMQQDMGCGMHGIKIDNAEFIAEEATFKTRTMFESSRGDAFLHN
jgi:cell division protein FtsN